jgi:hypothetical protein
MRLASSCADFNIMGETGLRKVSNLLESKVASKTHSHSSMKSSGNLVILFQSRTASKNFWQPKLSNSRFHVSNFALCWRRCLYPLRGLSSNTAYHVGMSKGLRGALLCLDSQRRWNWLGNPRVQRGRPARYDEILIGLVTSPWATLAVSSPWPDEGRVVVE